VEFSDRGCHSTGVNVAALLLDFVNCLKVSNTFDMVVSSLIAVSAVLYVMLMQIVVAQCWMSSYRHLVVTPNVDIT